MAKPQIAADKDEEHRRKAGRRSHSKHHRRRKHRQHGARTPPNNDPHPFKLYRPARVAELFDCDVTTVWRWRRKGVLPPPVKFEGVVGWTHSDIADVLAQRREEAR
jgi:predicted DNA-binding transcriptional regulator AlpA